MRQLEIYLQDRLTLAEARRQYEEIRVAVGSSVSPTGSASV